MGAWFLALGFGREAWPAEAPVYSVYAERTARSTAAAVAAVRSSTERRLTTMRKLTLIAGILLIAATTVAASESTCCVGATDNHADCVLCTYTGNALYGCDGFYQNHDVAARQSAHQECDNAYCPCGANATSCLPCVATSVVDRLDLGMIADLPTDQAFVAGLVVSSGERETTGVVGPDRQTLKVSACEAELVAEWQRGELYLVPGIGGGVIVVRGACDSDEECHERADELCRAEGHGAAKELGAKITTDETTGSKTCSNECEDGAVAFVICHPEKK